MQNLIINFLFKSKFDCNHQNALIRENEGYCPDCGMYLKKYFYIVRCKHCDIKREGEKKFDTITPKAKFCKNCGGSEFYIEKFEKISFIDIPYAIQVKETVENEITPCFSQIWVENEKKNVPFGLLKSQLKC